LGDKKCRSNTLKKLHLSGAKNRANFLSLFGSLANCRKYLKYGGDVREFCSHLRNLIVLGGAPKESAGNPQETSKIETRKKPTQLRRSTYLMRQDFDDV
jgi:hypothetical protein